MNANNISNNSLEGPDVSRDSAASAINQFSTIVYCSVLPTICVIGIVGNIMNLATLNSRRLRSVSYMYLRALALADLLCMIFVLIFAIINILENVRLDPIILFSWSSAWAQSHLLLSAINWSISSAVLIVVGLTLERYFSICHPLLVRNFNSIKRSQLAIVIAFSFPLLFYVPHSIWRYEVAEMPYEKATELFDAADNFTTLFVMRDNRAVVSSKFWEVFKYTKETALRFIPIGIIATLNIQIMIGFRRRHRLRERLCKAKFSQSPAFIAIMPAGSSGPRPDTSSREDGVMLLLAGIVVMFFVCNIPAAINLMLISDQRKSVLAYQYFRDFYVFCLCSSDYRASFQAKFPCFQKAGRNFHSLANMIRREMSIMERNGPMITWGRARPGYRGSEGYGSTLVEKPEQALLIINNETTGGQTTTRWRDRKSSSIDVTNFMFVNPRSAPPSFENGEAISFIDDEFEIEPVKVHKSIKNSIVFVNKLCFDEGDSLIMPASKLTPEKFSAPVASISEMENLILLSPLQ